MIPHHVIFLHGIGKTCDDFSLRLQRTIRKEFMARVTHLSSDTPPENSLHFDEARWCDVTQPDQDRLWDTLFDWMSPRGCLPAWSKFKARPLTGLMNIIYRLKYWSLLRRLVINLQGDVIAYLESPGTNKYGQIHRHVYAAFERCAALTCTTTTASPRNPALITVVAHSLGAVIASDMLYDTLIKKTRWWPPQIRLANLISLGSPLALYALRYGPEAFQKTVRMQDRNGLWINIYDPQDVIGYPLKGLNAAYRDAVFIDKVINAGQWWNPWHLLRQWTLFSHDLYFEDNTVAAIIGRKAALDWLQTNRPNLEAQLKQEYGRYRTWLATVDGGLFPYFQRWREAPGKTPG